MNKLVQAVCFYVLLAVPVGGQNCPSKQCMCYGDTVSCPDQLWTTLPPSFPNGTRQLFLNGNRLTAIPANSLPSGLSALDLRENPIANIDDSALDGSVNTLVEIYISGAKFTELPAALGHLNTLLKLVIEDTHISSWNDDIVHNISQKVGTLLLNNVGFTSWPGWVEDFPRLSQLELSGGSFIIPDDAFSNDTSRLSTLTLNNNAFRSFPKMVSKLSNLEFLILSNNHISTLESLPKRISWLDLSYNNISDARVLADSLKPLAGTLTYLRLDDNELIEIPDLSQLTRLNTLVLSKNEFSNTSSGAIPDSLTYLALENSSLTSLSHFLSNGRRLQTLRLNFNYLAELVGEDIPLNVNELDVSNNLLTEINNSSFQQGAELVRLFLDFNPITTVEFGNLEGLQLLSLKGTKLKRLPVSLGSLTSLFSFDVSDNPDLVCTCAEKDLSKLSKSLKYLYGDCGPTTVRNFLDVLSLDCPK